MTPATKTAIRTTMPFDDGLSPLSDKSRGVPMFGGTPLIQDLLDGQSLTNDLKGRGAWSSEPEEDHNYREKGDEYRTDESLARLDRQRAVGRKRSRRWVAEMEDGSQYEFPSEAVARTQVRIIGKKPRRFFMRSAADVGVVSEVVDACVGVVSTPPDTQGGVGAAFCFAKGMFLTCAHVIRTYPIGSSKGQNKAMFIQAKVEVSRGDIKVPARVIGIDLVRDIAVLEADLPSNVLRLSDSKNHPQGEDVIVVGSPKGYENTVSEGIVGGIDRVVFTHEGAPLHVFTDAKILPGNSGGPMVSAKDGSVIGMVEIIVGEDVVGLNAAIGSEYLVASLKEMGIATSK